ncbi:ParB/RepB/Spo0J family partition protein [Anaerocolumna aminovalerica]|uniref:Chromosome partitioning protein, ParB family n=1 Tax=Anaerocolumna aminovalerica TaxID=1527 RepID=A0A1I5HSQ1_9FIRM|nr:ParB/RepB/Spo0J family partition protein [Anaerocolumna aminovalerica]MBU5333021.1 ParB/RepB/Spo0J family partition protein [Anaerocolumna aminovalerica]SFO51322.1 chromosome partitioning protein, ParB family [Anaerocolumna aminovalerica]
MAALKKGLGKGLDSMIPEKIDNDTNKDRKKEIDENVSRETLININEIEPNRGQPRKSFEEDTLQELADSIKQYGIIQPLILQKKGKYYSIIAGERRWRAARIAGLKKVPAIIKEYTPQESMEIALIENIQRQDLNPIEEAMAYQNLIKEFNLKQDEVAERVSKSRVAITNSMRLLKLDERVQQMITDGMISTGHGRALLSIEDKDIQYQIAMKVFDEKLSVREIEKLVKKILEDKPVKEEIAVTKEDSFIYHNIEEKMKKIIGTKVSIKRKAKDKGRIEIEYYSTDELERIIEMFEALHE